MVLRAAPARGPVDLVTVREVDGHPVIDTITAPDRDTAASAVDHALVDPAVLDVSLQTTVRIEASTDDPYRTRQWALDALNAEQAWSHQRADGVVVAVIDTGVAAGHPDLAGVVLPGRDFVTPGGNGQTDGHGHGTHVAGLIAALSGNGLGIAGLAPGAKILPIRSLDDDGVGSDAAVANGIVWATDNGAKIINLSIGSPDNSTAEAAAVSYAIGRGVLVVAAAGNLRAQGNPTSYPAALPGVLGVAASDQSNRTASFSDTGSYVDVTAPGVNLVSTYPPSTYAWMDGTSMAAPLVSAAAALVRAADPGLSPAQVTTVLEQTAEDLETPGRDNSSGYGLVQPAAAVDVALRLAGGSGTAGGSAANAGSGSPTASATAPAPTPSASPRPARPSTLTVTAASPRVAYQGTATVTLRLATSAGPLVDATLAVCARPAGGAAQTCAPAVTDANGVASARLTLTANSTVSARYAGTSAVGASTSAAVAVAVLPAVRIFAATGSATLTITPVAAGETVRWQRRTDAGWTAGVAYPMPSSGRLTVTGLTSGATYRASVPATASTVAAVSSTIRIG